MSRSKLTKDKFNRIISWLIPGEVFLRPEGLIEDVNGLSPEIIFYEWETYGKTYFKPCYDIEKLADYIQGKKLRDWHIREWTKEIKESVIFYGEILYPSCFYGKLGMDAKEFQSVFSWFIDKYMTYSPACSIIKTKGSALIYAEIKTVEKA